MENVMKNFLKFIAVLFIFIYVWQFLAAPEFHVVIDNQHQYSNSIWFQALIAPVVAIISVVILFVLFSIFGALLVSLVVLAGVLLFVGLSIFWPTVFALVVCYWLFSDRKQSQINDY
jgi:hypothetical protein